MLNKENFEYFLNEIVKININGIKYKTKHLENFTKQEHYIREYHLALSEFEKAQSEVSLKNFGKLYDRILDDLYDFDPYNVQANIQKIMKHIDYIQQYKDNLLSVSNQINLILNKWNKFLSKNKQFETSTLHENFLKSLEDVQETMIESGINNVAAIDFKLESLNDKVDKNLGLIGTLNKYKNFYMFQGEEAKSIEEKIKRLLDISPDKKEGDFLDEGEALKSLIERTIANSKTNILGVPVIVAKNIKDKDIKRYTLKFKEYILKEDPFFNSKGIDFLKTNEYFYISGVPRKGIFEGKEIIKNLSVYENYALAVEEYIEASLKNFHISIGIFLFLGFISIGISNIIVSILFMLLTIGGYFLFSTHLNALKENIEEKYKIKNMFIYKSLDMVIYDKGYDVNVEELIEWVYFKLDETIYNKENIESEDLIWLENQ